MSPRRSKAAARTAVRRMAWILAGACALALAALLLIPEREAGPEPPPATPPAEPATPVEAARERAPAPAKAYPETAPSPAPSPRRRPPRRGAPARVAIIIDDVGYRMEPVEDLLQLRLPVTFAVIPRLAHSRQAARKATSHGFEVMLHQPMEPEGYPGVDVGEGAILVGMLPSEVERILDENLKSVPGARGINNHMGSRATQDTGLMRTFLSAAASKGLFFLDSRTTPLTVAEEVARDLRIPTGRRHVFLDNDRDVEKILLQIDLLLDRARRDGQAIGIGHADPRMVRALELARPRLVDGSISMVPASALMN